MIYTRWHTVSSLWVILAPNINAIYIHKTAWYWYHLSSNPVRPALPLSLVLHSASVSLWIGPYPCRLTSHRGDQCYNMLPLCACNPADPFTLIFSLSWGDWQSLSWGLCTDLMAVQLHTQENGYSDSGKWCVSVQIQHMCKGWERQINPSTLHGSVSHSPLLQMPGRLPPLPSDFIRDARRNLRNHSSFSRPVLPNR